MTTKPLFVPLYRRYFLMFVAGLKTVEYRHGARWNEQTCFPGRSVILRLGYRGARLSAVVDRFERLLDVGASSVNPLERLTPLDVAIHLRDVRPLEADEDLFRNGIYYQASLLLSETSHNHSRPQK